MPVIYQSNNPSNRLQAPPIKVERKHIKDAYFATREEKPVYEGTTSTYTVKSGDTLSKIANANTTTVAKLKADNKLSSDLITVGQQLSLSKATKKGDNISFTKAKEAKVGDELYIIVETENASDLALKINIKQGVEDGIAPLDEAIVIQQDDKDTNCIKATVGNYCNEAGVLNKDDFKDWAIAKVVLQPKSKEKQKEWSDTLNCLKDKKSNVYLLVDAHSDNEYHITYYGYNPDDEGKPNHKTCPNRWLDMEGKWFEIGIVSVLEEMKKLVDRHIKYSQTGVRDSLSEEGLKGLDCSETVAIYLYKLGVMPKLQSIYTGLMTTEKDFREAIGSENISWVPKSDKKNFKPQRGDVFVWRKSNGVGHTGIVYEYNSTTDLVTILEAIGNVGSADESTNKNNGGHKGKGCSRTAVYKRTGKALYKHSGWKGYFRPKNYSKKL